MADPLRMCRRLRSLMTTLILSAAAAVVGWGALPAGEQPTHPEKSTNPTMSLTFQGCRPWTNGVGPDVVAPAPQLQLEDARAARADNREFSAAEKYFQLVRKYPDAPQSVAALLEVSNLLLDLGYPSKAAYSMDQVLKRSPSGTLEDFDVDLPNLMPRQVGNRRRGDLAPAISRLEASVGLTLLEADRLGFTDATPGVFSIWPFSLFHSADDNNPFYNRTPSIFRDYYPLDLSRQFSQSQWVPGRSSLRSVIVYAYDASFYAEKHLNAMIDYDPLSYEVFAGYFHRGRLNLNRDEYTNAIADFKRIQINFHEALRNRNYPGDTKEISAFGDMYSAWSSLLHTPEPWKDRREDEEARKRLTHAKVFLHTFGLLQLEPVVDALNQQLDRRLARRYVRMADFYDRNDAPAAADLMRFYLRIAAPSTPEAAATLELNPWRTSEQSLDAAP